MSVIEAAGFTPPDILGCASSIVLLVTLSYQIHRQWSNGTSEGVSVWLFVGQLVASLGFTVYSVLVGNNVFVATNAALSLAAIVGLAIVTFHRARERRASEAARHTHPAHERMTSTTNRSASR